MASFTTADSAKAYRLRKQVKAGVKLRPLEMAWLVDFDHRKKQQEQERAAVTDVGASRSRKSRKLHVDLEEHAEAESVGTGSAASEAAVAAVMIDAEGKRVDQLTINALKIYEKCVDGWAKMGTVCRRVLREVQRSNVEFMKGYRDQYIGAGNLQLQIERMLRDRENSGDGDPINALMTVVAARHFGIDPDMIPGLADMAAKMGKGAANGAPKNGASKK